MLKLLLFTALLSASPDPPQSGRATDARTGTPIAHAELAIVGARATVRTDAEGRFVWPAALRPPLDVVVILADGRISRPVRVIEINPHIETRIAVELVRTDSVTVLGVAPDIDVADGAATALIAAPDLLLRRPVTLVEALENVTGVGAISEGQGVTPAIRGLARGRTLILVDGTRVMSERGAGTNASFLDPATLRSVEVARGSGSVAYGSDAFGGIIAARTRRPDFNTPFLVRGSATTGTGVPGLRADAELTKGYGRGGILFGARQRSLDDYSSPAGEVPHSSWRDAGAWLRWAHDTEAGLWSVGWQTDLARDVHRPRSDSNAMVATSPYEDSHRLTASYERRELLGVDDVRVDALAGWSRQRQEQERLPAPGRPRRIDRSDSSAQDFQVRLTGRERAGPVRMHGGLDLHGRFDYTADDTAVLFNANGAQTSTQTSQSIDTAHRTTIGAFIDTDTAVNSWMDLSAGLRIDAIGAVNRGGFWGDRSIHHAPLAGAAAVTIAPADDLTVTAQVARGFRDPTLTDRFYRGPVGRGFVEGNPDLEPETSLQLDVTARYAIGRMRVEGAVYDYRLDNLVERYSAGPDLFRLRNRARARFTGVEVDVAYNFGGGLAAEFGAQASRGRDRDTGSPLDDVSPSAARIVLRYDVSPRLASYFRLAAVGADTHSGPGEVPAPAYTLVDVGVEWRVSRLLVLRGLVRNALDESYYSSAGPRWVWAPGRQLLLTISVLNGT